jgi:carboxylate-amine ligase
VLKEQGELSTVEFLLFQVLARGTGAVRQRSIQKQEGSLREVIADAVRITNVPVTPFRDFTPPLLPSARTL